MYLTDIWKEIFVFFDNSVLLRISRVCKLWCELSSEMMDKEVCITKGVLSNGSLIRVYESRPRRFPKMTYHANLHNTTIDDTGIEKITMLNSISLGYGYTMITYNG